MNDFLDRLRTDARQLQYQPDSLVLARLQARVRERIAQPTVTQLLASWFRPLGVSLAALSLVGALSAAYYVETRDQVTIDSLASNSVEVSLGGETYSVD